mmetsp:Transcript_29733/g.74366  ORF Transcript_29733/g.74366 Transcript_29733/m.74366 type:complete len:225 (-) Transcript_29733:323-997(-)
MAVVATIIISCNPAVGDSHTIRITPVYAIAATSHVLREEQANLNLLTRLNVRLPDDIFDQVQSVSHSPGGAAEGNTAGTCPSHLVGGLDPYLSARLRLDAGDGLAREAANHPGPIHLLSATAAAAAVANTAATTAAAAAAATIDLFEEAGTGNNNRPTLLPVRTALDQLGEVLDSGIVAAGNTVVPGPIEPAASFDTHSTGTLNVPKRLFHVPKRSVNMPKRPV